MRSPTALQDTASTSRVPLGQPIPPHTQHAISVSLPEWRDNVGYEEGEKRVMDVMVSGYPRFFIHLSIQKLASICEQKYTVGDEKCMLFPTQRIAEQCRFFIQRRYALNGTPASVRLVQLYVESSNGPQSSTIRASIHLHIVMFPSHSLSIAKEFWQHTGLGISSRLAEKCLSILPVSDEDPFTIASRFLKLSNKHYSSTPHSHAIFPLSLNNSVTEKLSSDHDTYLEERYGRNLPLQYAASAKRALRRRIAGVLVRDNAADCQDEPCAGRVNEVLGPSSRGIADVSEHDVYLLPTGMSAIFKAHYLSMAIGTPAKSVCFGFPYTDTLKILQKWGPGCRFLGYGLDWEIDQLEKDLQEETERDPNTRPISALFTEFPSNPLLRSADLARLRVLADKYDFLIVIDETIGNFVNVEVLPYADIVVSSLTKVFSGSSNVMGGSLVLNPRSRHHGILKATLDNAFEDVYFDEDAIYMERNSRDFKKRIGIIDTNTEAVCGLLHARSVVGGSTEPFAALKEVHYPKYTTPDHYNRCRTQPNAEGSGGGYGGLFSLTFTSIVASKAFFDALPCCKGPSLGTNFTLACPFTILAHYGELEWAAGYGVEEGLVRVSVGMEEREGLLRSFTLALEAAETAVEGQTQ